jgi:hypothetical protein
MPKHNHHGHTAFFDNGLKVQRSRQENTSQVRSPRTENPDNNHSSQPLICTPLTFSLASPRMLLLLGLVVIAASKEFPVDGTYKDQSDYVKSLSGGCRYEISRAMQSLRKEPNPFIDILRPDLDVQIEVWKHSVDPKFDTATRRHKVLNSRDIPSTDKTEIIVPGTSTDGSVLYTFNLDAEGNWKPTSVTAGIFDKEVFGGSEAYVYKGSDGDQTCFSYKDPEPTATPRP